MMSLTKFHDKLQPFKLKRKMDAMILQYHPGTSEWWPKLKARHI